MGYSFAIAVSLPAWTVAILSLVFGASWLMALTILMGATALGGAGLAAALLSGDSAEQDGLSARVT